MNPEINQVKSIVVIVVILLTSKGIYAQEVITIGFDIGIEQMDKDASTFNTWFNSTVIMRYIPTISTVIAVREEYYDDRDSVLLPSIPPNGFRTWAFSVNFDCHITMNFLWRFEASSLINKDNIFTELDGTITDTNTFLTTALAMSF